MKNKKFGAIKNECEIILSKMCLPLFVRALELYLVYYTLRNISLFLRDSRQPDTTNVKVGDALLYRVSWYTCTYR